MEASLACITSPSGGNHHSSSFVGTSSNILPTPSKISSGRASEQSPLLALPTEIRLQIYSLLVLPRNEKDLDPFHETTSHSTRDYFDYEKKQPGTDFPNPINQTLFIRNIDPILQRESTKIPNPSRVRSTYSVRCDRFRARTLETTYNCINDGSVCSDLALLRANRQLHAEVAELLYSTYTFDFDTHIEAIVPFLSDLTPISRSYLRFMRIVKRALAYEKDFDRCEWASAMQYISNPDSGLGLRSLKLCIVAGKPGSDGWDNVETYVAGDFRILKEMEGMEWLLELLAIKGLQSLDVEAVVEHCAPATNSRAMAGYIKFSASIETALAEYLREHMLHC